jgi:hypothetical protein
MSSINVDRNDARLIGGTKMGKPGKLNTKGNKQKKQLKYIKL